MQQAFCPAHPLKPLPAMGFIISLRWNACRQIILQQQKIKQVISLLNDYKT